MNCGRCNYDLYSILYPTQVAGLAPGVLTPVPHGYLAINCPACGSRNITADTAGKPPVARDDATQLEVV